MRYEATAYRWRVGWSGGIIRTIRAEGHEGTDWRMPLLEVDEDYLNVFQIELVEGRKFDPIAFPTDTSMAFIINERQMFGSVGMILSVSLLSGLIGREIERGR